MRKLAAVLMLFAITAFVGCDKSTSTTAPGGNLPSGVSGKVVMMTYCCAASGSPYTNGQQVLFTFSSSGALMLTPQYTVVSSTFTVTSSNEYQWVDASGLKYTLSLITTGTAIGQINEVNINSAANVFLGQFNNPQEQPQAP